MHDAIVVLGPTACGKTALGVALAAALNGEIISADSRQVYRYLDIGSGKDLADYTLIQEDGTKKLIPYHLIDVTALPYEYSVYDYQRDAYQAIASIRQREKLPVVVGGTGMYLDALVRGYDLLPVPTNEKLREELAGKSMEELTQRLLEIRGVLHNHTDLDERHRLLRAIEIAEFQKNGCESASAAMPQRPPFHPIILGTTFPREQLRQNIKVRLRQRLKEGMIQEVQSIHDSGIEWRRLERLGLEYKFVSQFLQGIIPSEGELFSQLNIAIGQFAKRQETWFRGMERRGIKIHWLTPGSREHRVAEALEIIASVKN
jgi:tRNA dimethylallyltransferase